MRKEILVINDMVCDFLDVLLIGLSFTNRVVAVVMNQHGIDYETINTSIMEHAGSR